MDLRAVIEAAVADGSTTYAALSKLIRRNPAYIQQYVKRGTPVQLPRDVEAVLCAHFNIDEAQLDRVERARAPRSEKPAKDWPSTIPIRGEVAAGMWEEIGETSDGPLGTAPFSPFKGFPVEATYSFRVKGDSVDRIAPAGALLVCLDYAISGIEVADDDLVIVERRRFDGQEREITAKRVRKIRGGCDLIPESTNPKWKPVRYRSNQPGEDGIELRIVARVEWVATRPNGKSRP